MFIDSETGTSQLHHVGLLIQWGLRVAARPAQEEEYRKLINRYHDEPAFRAAVRETCSGLGLAILDVSEHGLVLAALESSVFTFTPSEFRSGGSPEDRLLDGLVQIAIAATVFPRARDLDESVELARPPVTVAEVEATLRGISDHFAEQQRSEADPEASAEQQGLTEAWRIYQRRLPSGGNKRQSPRSTLRIIAYSLEKLRDHGCFTLNRDSPPAWQPTRRYQVHVQQLAASRIHQEFQRIMRRAGSNAAPLAPQDDS